jgi:hypothetical protein
MKRTLIVSLLLIVAISSATEAQRRRGGRKKPKPATSSTAGGGKSSVPCPSTLNSIQDCPDTGCGPSLDPNLNKEKNIRTDNDAATDKDFQDLATLPDPVPGFAIGNTREKLTALGEGTMIRVVAYALIARKGSKESCNCGLKSAADTDNHIVLVDPTSTNPSLADEPDSQTAEFTPRVRLDHPKLAGARLQALVAATPNQALLVRVTGLQMFDSEHSLGPLHLKRHNNWEIHPVFALEYCPTGKSCTKGSAANWKNLEN